MEDARDGRFKGLLAPVCTKNKYAIGKKKVCWPTGNFVAQNIYTHIRLYTVVCLTLTGASHSNIIPTCVYIYIHKYYKKKLYVLFFNIYIVVNFLV